MHKPPRIFDAINCSIAQNFTQIPNTMLRDPELSCKAKGLLAMLLSNREGWTSYAEVLKSMTADGETAIQSGLKELEVAGYLWRVSYVDKNTKAKKGSFWAYTNQKGQFNLEDHLAWLGENDMEIWNGSLKKKPEKPYMENPVMASPVMGNQGLIIHNNNNTNLKEYITEKLYSPDGEPASGFEKETDLAHKPSKRNIPTTTESKTPPIITPEEVLAYWNGIMKDTPIPKVMKLSSVRKKHLQARIKEIPCRKEWREIFKRIASSKFLRGESGGGDWRANFDWIISNDTNYAKVMEGRYDSTPKNHNMERNMKIDRSKYKNLQINRRTNDGTEE